MGERGRREVEGVGERGDRVGEAGFFWYGWCLGLRTVPEGGECGDCVNLDVVDVAELEDVLYVGLEIGPKLPPLPADCADFMVSRPICTS